MIFSRPSTLTFTPLTSSSARAQARSTAFWRRRAGSKKDTRRLAVPYTMVARTMSGSVISNARNLQGTTLVLLYEEGARLAHHEERSGDED